MVRPQRTGLRQEHSRSFPSSVLKRFGERVRQVRNQKRITQVALCHKISMEQKTLSAVENGSMQPCLRNIELLAIGLGGAAGETV